MKTPPQPPPRWDLSPSVMLQVIDRLVSVSSGVWDRVAAIDPAQVTFENAILPIIHDEQSGDAESAAIRFLDSVSPSREIREAATEGSLRLAHSKIN